MTNIIDFMSFPPSLHNPAVYVQNIRRLNASDVFKQSNNSIIDYFALVDDELPCVGEKKTPTDTLVSVFRKALKFYRGCEFPFPLEGEQGWVF